MRVIKAWKWRFQLSESSQPTFLKKKNDLKGEVDTRKEMKREQYALKKRAKEIEFERRSCISHISYSYF